MADKDDGSGTMRVPANVFNAVTIGVMRAHVLLWRGTNGEPTGSGAALEMEDEADRLAQQAIELLTHTAGPLRETMAQEFGWPSADALVAFLFDGPSAGAEH